jgi:hypothetical protein
VSVSDNLVSPNAFNWTLTVLTGVFAGVWLLYDLRNLTKLRGADFSDPLVRDRRFGYLMGIGIAIIGLVGVLHFQGVI